MAKSCCVDGCIAKDEVFFRFPNSRTRCKKWMEAMELTGKLSYKSLVCSAHFQPDDYGFVRGKVRLKPKVVPSLLHTKLLKSIPSVQKLPTSNDNVERTAILEDQLQNDRLDNVSPNNNEVEKEVQKYLEKKDSKVTAKNKRTKSTRKDKAKAKKLQDSVTETVKPSPSTDTMTEKDDIEDILTYFHIKQNKQVAERQNAELEREKNRQESGIENGDAARDDQSVIDVELSPKEAEKPVFIEVAVDQGNPNSRDSGSPHDCVMLLESVQVELDPNELLLPERDEEDEEIVISDKPDDPVSLLTSSDEDDVIIQEPHIDTVEVSDETDEDDVPLVKLAETESREPRSKRAPNPFYRKNALGAYQYHCMECRYRTYSRLEYKNHVAQHSTAILLCQKCGYTTASKAQFARHKKKHKEEKRFQCHICEYKARHNMSLIYHLKSHDSASENCFKCDKCGFKSDLKRYLMRHVQLCGVRKLFACDSCSYESMRSSDLKKHKKKKHACI